MGGLKLLKYLFIKKGSVIVCLKKLRLCFCLIGRIG